MWIDLGIHIEACMTDPETCGEAGGAISLWLRVIDCPTALWAGIVTTRFFRFSNAGGISVGSAFECSFAKIR